MSNVTLTAGVRNSLLALQSTAQMMTDTQNRLSTGKKVNSALDNPTSFFTASSLSARASDLGNLLDSMSNGIQTIQAANNGLTSITSTIQQLQATASQARQDASWQSNNYTYNVPATGGTATNKLVFTGGAVSGTLNVSTQLWQNTGTGSTTTVGTGKGGQIDVTIGSVTKTITTADTDTIQTVANNINAAFGSTVAGLDSGGHLQLTDLTDTKAAIADHAGNTNGTTAALGFTGNGAATTNGKTIDQLVTAINGASGNGGAIVASNNGGKLQIQNISIGTLNITGANATNGIDGGAETDTVTGNTVRKALVNQFNSLRAQLDQTAADSGYNGINLLAGDDLKLNFNAQGTSSIDVQSKDASGSVLAINSANLGISAATNTQFGSNSQLDSLLTGLQTSLTTVRSQASALGSSLSVVQNRQTFTKAMINTLQQGSDNLTVADTNEESANMLALQTRQSLSVSALSLANQASQAVLRLFG